MSYRAYVSAFYTYQYSAPRLDPRIILLMNKKLRFKFGILLRIRYYKLEHVIKDIYPKMIEHQ